MSRDKTVFHNLDSGESFVHRDRPDGKRDLKFGPTGSSLPGHAVLGQDGNVSFLRESDGRTVANDKP